MEHDALIVLWIGGAAIGVSAALVAANSLRFGRRVSREVREMWAGTAETRSIEHARFEEWPAPVRRYLSKALGTRRQTVRTVRLRQCSRNNKINLEVSYI